MSRSAPAAPPVGPTTAAVGKLGGTAAFLPVPVGNVLTKLTRVVGDGIEYLPPPVGQGFKRVVWERDALAGPGTYVLKAESADLSAAVPLGKWRGSLDFPNRAVTDRRSASTKRLTEFARSLLTLVASLHQQKWRLGLTDAENLYVIARDDGMDLFLPDLGFAYLSPITLAKPNWLATHPRDADTWGEDRTARQLAAPNHYRTRHPQANDWDDLAQKDLRLVARLLEFVLTGDVTGAEPPAAGRCPVWHVIKDADVGIYTDTDDGTAAENMLADLLRRLHAPPEQPVELRAAAQQKKRGVGPFVVILVLGLILGVVITAWLMLANKTKPTSAPTGTSTPTTTGTGQPIEPPPSDDDTKRLENLWSTAKDLIDKAKAAIELAKKNPQHPLVSRTRLELLAEIKEAYRQARNGEAVPLRSRELIDLLNQLPAPEAPK